MVTQAQDRYLISQSWLIDSSIMIQPVRSNLPTIIQQTPAGGFIHARENRDGLLQVPNIRQVIPFGYDDTLIWVSS